MVFPLICVLVYPVVVFALIRAAYLVVFEHGKGLGRRVAPRHAPAKTLIVLGSGGHTSEILRVLRHLDRANYAPRVYVQAQTDRVSRQKVEEFEGDSEDYRLHAIPRSRRVGQSYLTSIFTTARATLHAFPLIFREKPDLLLCNGPGTCVPLCLVALFFNALLFRETKIVFVESFCRVERFSLSGRILYYLANHTIVQWPKLNGSRYPRSIFV
ncbi:UDP-N-acetylglucosamine transferase subunit ALG14 homolog [Trichogramma pretiosum]|uniref:UDP-N-acetylglucosamine transferase subunit ALG14 homolog n=1 Tax=Trichogramma pretiosum TaxID=7493 RepID=UPI0006C97951|nr:UDP-N-acetylglucosamine transferase subunit ALG14 homolog [Trichogramma pretiosum]